MAVSEKPLSRLEIMKQTARKEREEAQAAQEAKKAAKAEAPKKEKPEPMTREQRAAARAAAKPVKAKTQAEPEAQPVATEAPAKYVRRPKAVIAKQEPDVAKAAVKAKADKAEARSKGEAIEEPKFTTREPVSNVAPTLDAAEQFQKAFDYFNTKLFDGKLEQAMITWESKKMGKGKAAGFFSPDRWGKKAGKVPVHQISLCPIYHGERDTKLTLSTLVHEMCHEYVQQSGKAPVKPYHCKRWVKIMTEVGLNPIIVNAKGEPLPDKDVGKNATHEIEKGGRFEVACNALLKEGFVLAWARVPDPVAPKSNKPPKPKARIKHECPKCGEWAVAKRDHSLVCKPCKAIMVPEETDEPSDDDNAE